jgi:endo-1,4-beta-xylanase
VSNVDFGYLLPWTNGVRQYLCVYGWTQNPLIEYYILENYGEYNPGNSATRKGNVTYDGSTYGLFQSQRTNQPSIEGTKTFQQYWAIRQTKRTGGTVDTGFFFDAWTKANMPMGKHNYMVLATEGYRSAGQASINVTTPA